MRRKHGSEFKSNVSIEALKDQETLSSLSEKYKVSAVMIFKWKNEFVENASAAFSNPKGRESQEKKEQELYAKIGKLEVKLDFAKRASSALGMPMVSED